MPITETSKYTNRLSIVFLPEERGRLQALADDEGLRESEVMRNLINEAYAARFGKKPPPPVRPKYNSDSARKAKAKRAKK